MTLTVNTPHAEGKIVAEICRDGGSTYDPEGDDPLVWYIDAAYIEAPDGEKVRDLTDDEMNALQDDKDFCQLVGKAFHEWERDYDPTE